MVQAVSSSHMINVPECLHWSPHDIAWLQMAKFEMTRISNRMRFILAVISGEKVVSNRKRAEIEAQLEADGYDRMPNTKKVLHARCVMPDQGSLSAAPAPLGLHVLALLLDYAGMMSVCGLVNCCLIILARLVLLF